MSHQRPFTLEEARQHWFRIVAGWADHLDSTGTRLLIDGHTNAQDEGGSYEGVTRMLWGLGGWLSQPGREGTIEWRGKTYDLVTLTRDALVNGTAPNSAGYWFTADPPHGSRQRIVESGQVGFALWQSRHQIWDHLAEPERENIVAWLEACGQPPERWNNNWALFWAVNHASRKAIGQRHDQALIDSVLTWLDDVWCGNGWYDDGAARGANHFDDYNLWVFASHVLAWAQLDGQSASMGDMLLDRVRQQMEHVPYFFAADGSYPEFGRSLSYKFARLGGMLWAYQAGVWPHSPGLLKRIVGRHLRWYLDRGALRADGTLRQELTADGHPDIRETYISTGATYWAMQAFGGLWSIPDTDPFWTADEEPLPVERASFTMAFPEPGWMLTGNKTTGHITRYSARSQHTPAKYGKFAYSTAAPFNVGTVDGSASPDNMFSLGANGEWSHRQETTSSEIGDNWLRFRYPASLDAATHQIETVIVINGDHSLRLHRISLDPSGPAPLFAVEGAAPVGYPFGGEIRRWLIEQTMYSGADHAGLGSSIQALAGWTIAIRPMAWLGDATLNAVHPSYVLPMLHTDSIENGQVFASLVTIGITTQETQIPEWDWQADNSVNVFWNGRQVTIPPLPAS